MGKISEEKNNVGDNNEERDTFNEDIKETSNRVRLRKPKKKVSRFVNCIGCTGIESHYQFNLNTCKNARLNLQKYVECDPISYRCEESVVEL